MKTTQQMRVLMLGWEYPPRFAGGLGKACQGLAQAIARQGVQVFFVLPRFPNRISDSHLEVVGAEECLTAAGWDQPRNSGVFFEGGLHLIQSEARLSPYAIPTSGPIPESIQQFMSSQVLDPQAQTSIERQIYGGNLWSEIERFCFTARHLSDTHEVDLVHAHDWMTFPAAFEFQSVTRVPVYLHVHATEYDRSGEDLNPEVFRIERESFRRADHIFTVSRYTSGILEKLYGIQKKKISVIYNAPEESNRPILTSPAVRKPQVVFLGRLTYQKGPDHFLRAAALVKETFPSARFVMCGTGDLMENLRAQAFRMGIEKEVRFAGFLEPPAVNEVLLNSKVLVMPSVSEPFGLVALEAIRCGIPVILSKQSGVREVLPRTLHVDFWDHEKLADQIVAALRLSGLSSQLVQEGSEQLRDLSWDKSAKAVLKAYENRLDSTYAHAIGGSHGH